MSCKPFFLNSIKIKNEYNETKKMFQEKQSCSTSMIMQPGNNHDNKQDLSEESITNPTKKQSNISADKKVLGRDFAMPDAFLFKQVFSQKCYMRFSKLLLKNQQVQPAMYMRHFRHLCQCIQSFKLLYPIFPHGKCHLLSIQKQIIPQRILILFQIPEKVLK